MTLPVSGAISFNAINVELGVAGTTQANINQATYRTLAGVPSGQISLSNFYGKSNRGTASITYSASAADVSLNITSLSGYLAGNTDVTITINSGVYLYATSTANAGLTLTGGSGTDTLTIVNNGYIMGMGGNAGGSTTQTATPSVIPQAGGTALSLGFNTSITNNSYIGGGGGGGGGAGWSYNNTWAGGGGGAGGGNGGPTTAPGGIPGAGGSIGSSGAAAGGSSFLSGAGGGRIFPSTQTVFQPTAGSQQAPGGSGGAPGGVLYASGGAVRMSSTGGGPAQNGSAVMGTNGIYSGGGGGGWGASGGTGDGLGYDQNGASGGRSVALNGYSATFTVVGNRYGAVS
jgi:hypothetical protein